MCRYTPPCRGEGAELPQRGHDSKTGGTITIKQDHFLLFSRRITVITQKRPSYLAQAMKKTEIPTAFRTSVSQES